MTNRGRVVYGAADTMTPTAPRIQKMDATMPTGQGGEVVRKESGRSGRAHAHPPSSCRQQSLHLLDTLRPNVVSIISVSKEKRLVTRPMGVVSKNSMGARNTLASRPTNRRLAACSAMNCDGNVSRSGRDGGSSAFEARQTWESQHHHGRAGGHQWQTVTP
jgi:hypothetical protein